MQGKPRTEGGLDLVSDGLAFGMWTPKHVLLRLITLVAQVADLGTGWIIPVDPMVGGQSPVEELDNVNPVGESFPGAQSMSQWPPVNGIDQVSTDLLLFNQELDPSGMGRWSWIRLQRLGLPDLIIVTAYRVCISNNAHARQTAHLQQSRALTQQDCPVRDPRKAFLLDFGRFLRGHQQQEHSLMVLIDANDELKPATDWHTFTWWTASSTDTHPSL